MLSMKKKVGKFSFTCDEGGRILLVEIFNKKIRENSKTLIAMGACAMTGQPSGQRNLFSADQLAEAKDTLNSFPFLPKALSIKEAVKVDDEIIGCPINEGKFIEVFEKWIG